ncbi:hypothetical protein AB205_0053280 [Aquarana catesbeiana]|uniref:Uncharacterized protein n=1 Tax=Aquarana catesbeiana TaxID=8400 RepID=A0A2G9SKD7_AQUCT|nr:hypothetical protein AB205_0053280 [Aquarana catesbeiana]
MEGKGGETESRVQKCDRFIPSLKVLILCSPWHEFSDLPDVFPPHANPPDRPSILSVSRTGGGATQLSVACDDMAVPGGPRPLRYLHSSDGILYPDL